MSKTFFNGKDAGGINGLWVTDGTETGTHEIAVFGDNTSAGPTDIAALGSKGVVFNALGAVWLGVPSIPSEIQRPFLCTRSPGSPMQA